MLHTPSYNMGMAAGIAWKHAGKEHFHLGDVKEDTPEGNFILEILERSGETFFFPSSFMEGFYNAFHTEYKLIESPRIPAPTTGKEGK